MKFINGLLANFYLQEPGVVETDKFGNRRWYDSRKRLHRINNLPAVESVIGVCHWRVRGLPYRSDGGPTEIHSDGSQLWLDNLMRPHRKDGPAFIKPDGLKLWFHHGAFISGSDSKNFSPEDVQHEKVSYWSNNREFRMRDDLIWKDELGLHHRENGPALISFSQGGNLEMWFMHGKIHRNGGPAKVTTDIGSRSKFWGYSKWFQNGLLHREDGPASISSDGVCKWYINGKYHRDSGPAIERLSGSKEWWVNGKRLTEEAFLKWHKSTYAE